MIKDLKNIVLAVVSIILLFGTGCQSNKVRYIYVETTYFFYDTKLSAGTSDTVRSMNEAMLNKQLIRRFGRDKYYEIITNARRDTNYTTPPIKEDYYVKDAKISMYIIGKREVKMNYRDKYANLTGDVEFLSKLKRLRENSTVFMYTQYAHPSFLPNMIYSIGWLPKELKAALDTLSKDEFMQKYESRLDSILRLPIKYRKTPKGEIYDSRLNPIKY